MHSHRQKVVCGIHFMRMSTSSAGERWVAVNESKRITISGSGILNGSGPICIAITDLSDDLAVEDEGQVSIHDLARGVDPFAHAIQYAKTAGEEEE